MAKDYLFNYFYVMPLLKHHIFKVFRKKNRTKNFSSILVLFHTSLYGMLSFYLLWKGLRLLIKQLMAGWFGIYTCFFYLPPHTQS